MNLVFIQVILKYQNGGRNSSKRNIFVICVTAESPAYCIWSVTRQICHFQNIPEQEGHDGPGSLT